MSIHILRGFLSSALPSSHLCFWTLISYLFSAVTPSRLCGPLLQFSSLHNSSAKAMPKTFATALHSKLTAAEMPMQDEQWTTSWDGLWKSLLRFATWQHQYQVLKPPKVQRFSPCQNTADLLRALADLKASLFHSRVLLPLLSPPAADPIPLTVLSQQTQ